MRELEFRQELSQQLRLTPQMLQNMALLQMNIQDLRDCIVKAAEENPLLEISDPDDTALRALVRDRDWLRQSGAVESSTPPEAGAIEHAYDSIAMSLRDQLSHAQLDPRLEQVCLYIIGLLDENGYLAQEDWEELHAVGEERLPAQAALTFVQSLDPAGIAARSLEECLLLQIRRMYGMQDHSENHTVNANRADGRDLPGSGSQTRDSMQGGRNCADHGHRNGSRTTYEIVDSKSYDLDEFTFLTQLITHHLQSIASHSYASLAASLHVSRTRIEAAAQTIMRLNPHPGRRETSVQEEPAQYVQPDAYIIDEEDGTLSVVLNDYYLPRVTIDPHYEQLLHDKSTDAQTREYLRERMNKARDLLYGIDTRGDTLRRCIELVAQEQAAFFLLGDGVMRPVTRRDLAQELGVHPSTVTRALKNKYLQCRRGLYPLSAFFCRSVGVTAPQEIKARMTQLLAADHTLNDRQIWERLTAEGYTLTRRTVANYRKAMGVPRAGRRRV